MRFRGDYDFLSNFYPKSITFEGDVYPSVENAFQASKCINKSDREVFKHCSPKEAKKFGRQVKLRDDWEEVKIDLMTILVTTKFKDPKLAARLMLVQDTIIEHNTWHDNFWGSCTCERCNDNGYNVLGIILGEVRKDILSRLKGD